MLILITGTGISTLYQVMAMEDQLDEVTRNVDQMDVKVKRAQYEKAKFYTIARELVVLAPKDANAEQVATYFKLKELQIAQPELMAATTSDLVTTNASPVQPAAATNSAPILPSPVTNTAPLTSPSSAAK